LSSIDEKENARNFADVEVIGPDENLRDADVQIIDGAEGRIYVGPNLDDEVEFVKDETYNAKVRIYDVKASMTRSWNREIQIINGEQFYHHKSLRPPSRDNAILFGIYENVSRVLVTRRNIKEFKSESKNVYIRLVEAKSSAYWEDLKGQVRTQTYELFVEHGQKYLQTVFLPEVMQKFTDGNVMTYSDFYSLLPGGEVLLRFLSL
jgi:hypothetical protein